MIRQVVYIKHYWKVIIYYNIDYDLFKYAEKDLISIGITEQAIRKMLRRLKNKAKAVTVSNLGNHISAVIFNKHSNPYDYINSIVHEAEHIKQAMLKAYNVEDEGEPSAYTIGYLVMRMIRRIS